jgi:ABC-type nitrate/sulfonate/bicarbonate transport system permease component
VWEAFWEILTEGYRDRTLFEHVADSLYRVCAGFLLGVATAVPLGLAIGYSTRVQAVFDPLIEFYRPLPPLAYYTLLVIWLGIENASKIALLYLAAFPPLSVSAMAGVRGVSPERIQSAQSLGASRWQVFRHVIFPSCLPDIFTMVMLNGKEQLDAKYLGTCAKRGALAKALKDTADFLKAEKRIKEAPTLAAFEKGMNPCYLEKAVK